MGNLRFAIIKRFRKLEDPGKGRVLDEIVLEYDQDVLLHRLGLGVAAELAALPALGKEGGWRKERKRKEYSLIEVESAVRKVFRGIADELRAETIRVV